MEPANTAEWLWEALQPFGDYHKNMDSDGFMLWVRDGFCLVRSGRGR